MFATSWVQAKSTVVGDLILLGSVERSGQKLTNDTSVFEGDSIRTQKASGGVLTIARGRVEIGESSEVEVVRQNPLRIVVKSGTISVEASCTRSLRKFSVRWISAAPGRNASTEPGLARSAVAIASAICRSSGTSTLRPS